MEIRYDNGQSGIGFKAPTYEDPDHNRANFTPGVSEQHKRSFLAIAKRASEIRAQETEEDIDG